MESDSSSSPDSRKDDSDFDITKEDSEKSADVFYEFRPDRRNRRSAARRSAPPPPAPAVEESFEEDDPEVEADENGEVDADEMSEDEISSDIPEEDDPEVEADENGEVDADEMSEDDDIAENNGGGDESIEVSQDEESTENQAEAISIIILSSDSSSAKSSSAASPPPLPTTPVAPVSPPTLLSRFTSLISPPRGLRSMVLSAFSPPHPTMIEFENEKIRTEDLQIWRLPDKLAKTVIVPNGGEATIYFCERSASGAFGDERIPLVVRRHETGLHIETLAPCWQGMRDRFEIAAGSIVRIYKKAGVKKTNEFGISIEDPPKPEEEDALGGDE